MVRWENETEAVYADESELEIRNVTMYGMVDIFVRFAVIRWWIH